ncbi:MAG: hypothetical protein DRH12_11630 [Deltaproteobacteria bacterium]|nr:MAG: hypothetical protein DRH12_11630 [Deltaproteobacteria bacterium]
MLGLSGVGIYHLTPQKIFLSEIFSLYFNAFSIIPTMISGDYSSTRAQHITKPATESRIAA